MAEGDDPVRPKPTSPLPGPGQPLPRLWKAESDADASEPEDRRSRRAREREERERAETEARALKAQQRERESVRPKPKPKAAKSAKTQGAAGGKAGAKSGVLVEETPELDTYDARRRVRTIVGGGIAVLGLLGVFLLVQSFRGPQGTDEDLPDEGGQLAGPAAPASTPPAAEVGEQEARNLLGTAQQLAKNGKTAEAVVVLKRIVASHPKSQAATKAKLALDRPASNLPLFLDEPTVVASPSPGSPAIKAVKPTEVAAIDPRATPARPSSAEAQLELPVNPSEPSRSPPGLSSGKVDPAQKARPLPAGFRAEPESRLHASGWPYFIQSDRDGAVMCFVPEGSHTQGRNDGSPDEGPEHVVKLSAYYVDQHEVTNRQYDLYLKETGRRPTSPRKDRSDPELPMVNLSASEAQSYCAWSGKSLPTEAQWEAAARTTDARLYPWGSSTPVWSKPRSPRQIDRVMSFDLDQSPYAIFDLSGNAWEWTRDWFDSRYYQSTRGAVPDNPTGPSASRSKPPQVVVKGGSKLWVVTWREGLRPETRLPYVGFRGVLNIGPSTSPVGQGDAQAGPVPTGRPNPTRPPANANGVVPF